MRRVSRGWRGMIRCDVIESIEACLSDFYRACVFRHQPSISVMNGSTAFADDRLDVLLLYCRR